MLKNSSRTFWRPSTTLVAASAKEAALMSKWVREVVRHPLVREIALAVFIAVVASLERKRVR